MTSIFATSPGCLDGVYSWTIDECILHTEETMENTLLFQGDPNFNHFHRYRLREIWLYYNDTSRSNRGRNSRTTLTITGASALCGISSTAMSERSPPRSFTTVWLSMPKSKSTITGHRGPRLMAAFLEVDEENNTQITEDELCSLLVWGKVMASGVDGATSPSPESSQ